IEPAIWTRLPSRRGNDSREIRNALNGQAGPLSEDVYIGSLIQNRRPFGIRSNADRKHRQVVSRAVRRTQRATAATRNANQPDRPVDGRYNTGVVRAPDLQVDHAVRRCDLLQHFSRFTGKSDCGSAARPPWAHTARRDRLPYGAALADFNR